MTRRIRRFFGPHDLAQAAAEDFGSVLNKISADVAVGLCGGRSVSLFYRYCSNLFYRIKRPERIHFFLVDERLDFNQRNATSIYDEFLEPLLEKKLISEHQIHFSLESETLGQVQTELNDHLSSIRKSQDMDVLVLGVGEDGHIAGLFPNHQLLESNEKGYGVLSDSPKPPSKRITLLPETIQQSQTAFVFCVGPSKHEAFERLVGVTDFDPTLPASLIVSLSSVWIYQTDGEQ